MRVLSLLEEEFWSNFWCKLSAEEADTLRLKGNDGVGLLVRRVHNRARIFGSLPGSFCSDHVFVILIVTEATLGDRDFNVATAVVIESVKIEKICLYVEHLNTVVVGLVKEVGQVFQSDQDIIFGQWEQVDFQFAIECWNKRAAL